MKVFLDANVLFSASKEGSNIGRLVALLDRHATTVTSDLAYEEARRNIVLKRPAWATTLEEVMLGITLVPSAHLELPVELDDKDVPILSAAIRVQCQYLVTGDRRDFGHLFDKEVAGVTIISPLRLAELLTEGRNGDTAEDR